MPEDFMHRRDLLKALSLATMSGLLPRIGYASDAEDLYDIGSGIPLFLQ
jgi:hypothetical protein